MNQGKLSSVRQVLLDSEVIYRSLPGAIEAFTFPLYASRARADAMRARFLFLDTYGTVSPSSVPLVSFDREQSEPFNLVDET